MFGYFDIFKMGIPRFELGPLTPKARILTRLDYIPMLSYYRF